MNAPLCTGPGLDGLHKTHLPASTIWMSLCWPLGFCPHRKTELKVCGPFSLLLAAYLLLASTASKPCPLVLRSGVSTRSAGLHLSEENGTNASIA